MKLELGRRRRIRSSPEQRMPMARKIDGSVSARSRLWLRYFLYFEIRQGLTAWYEAIVG